MILLIAQVDKLTAENAKFEENNRALQEQNNVFAQNNASLTASVGELEEQAAKFKEVYSKLIKENERLSAVRDGLEKQLNVSMNHDIIIS